MIITRLFGLLVSLIISVIVLLASLRTTTKKQSLINALFSLYISIVYSMIWLPLRRNLGYWNPEDRINLIPFRYIVEEKSFAMLRDTLGNLFLFIPIGIYYAYKAKNSKWKYFLLNIFMCALAEVVQLLLCVASHTMYRAIDISDLILNIAGGVIGYWLYGKIRNHFTTTGA